MSVGDCKIYISTTIKLQLIILLCTLLSEFNILIGSLQLQMRRYIRHSSNLIPCLWILSKNLTRTTLSCMGVLQCPQLLAALHCSVFWTDLSMCRVPFCETSSRNKCDNTAQFERNVYLKIH